MVLKKISLAEQAYLALIQGIMKNEYAPGAPLAEATLADRFGISRTPVREALHRLSEEGLIEAEPRRGYRVKRLDRAAIRELFECRAIIEVEVMTLSLPLIPVEFWSDLSTRCQAAEQSGDRAASCEIDALMHEKLLACCPNQILREIAENLLRRSAPFRDLRNYTAEDGGPPAERRELTRCFRDRDVKRARELLRHHILQGIPAEAATGESAESGDFRTL